MLNGITNLFVDNALDQIKKDRFLKKETIKKLINKHKSYFMFNHLDCPALYQILIDIIDERKIKIYDINQLMNQIIDNMESVLETDLAIEFMKKSSEQKKVIINNNKKSTNKNKFYCHCDQGYEPYVNNIGMLVPYPCRYCNLLT